MTGLVYLGTNMNSYGMKNSFSCDKAVIGSNAGTCLSPKTTVVPQPDGLGSPARAQLGVTLRQVYASEATTNHDLPE